MGVARALIALIALVAAAGTASAAPHGRSLQPGPRVFAGFVGAAAHVRVTWPAAPEAARYRARWSLRDAASSATPMEIEAAIATPVFERDEPRPGHYTLEIAALDAAGDEIGDATIGVDVLAIRGVPPGADEPAPPASGSYALGATFASPGLTCAFDGSSDFADTARARAIGARSLTCKGEPPLTVSVPVVIAPIVLAPPPELPRGARVRAHVAVASVAALGDALDVVAIGDVAVDGVTRTDGGVDVSLRIPADARTAALEVQAAGIELGRVELALGAPAEAPRVDAPASWFALDVGGQAGAILPPSASRGASVVGHPTTPAGTLGNGGYAGGRVGLYPFPRLGIESELSIAATGYTGQAGTAPLALARVQLAGRIAEADRYALHLLAGVDILDVLTSTGASHAGAEAGLHLGAAFSVRATRELALRFEVVDVVTAAQDASYAHTIELQLGVATRIGRRDRW